jgi:hypothetical protein
MEVLQLVILGSYLLVVAELVFLPVPSEASLRSGGSAETSRSRLRLAVHGASIAVSCGAFAVPAVWLIAPGSVYLLGPLFPPGFGWAAVPSPFVLVGLVVCGVHMDRRVRVEERYLERTFGDAYAQYTAHVRRYVGQHRSLSGFASGRSC